jgi:hypothetical protein
MNKCKTCRFWKSAEVGGRCEANTLKKFVKNGGNAPLNTLPGFGCEKHQEKK